MIVSRKQRLERSERFHQTKVSPESEGGTWKQLIRRTKGQGGKEGGREMKKNDQTEGRDERSRQSFNLLYLKSGEWTDLAI